MGRAVRHLICTDGYHVNSPRLPETVQALLYEHIVSYEQLEILLLLRLESTETWTDDRIGDRMDLPSDLVSSAVSGLISSGFLTRQQDTLRCQYAPRSTSLDEAVNQLARAYALQRLEVVKLMTANAIKRLRTNALNAFAESFVIHKDKD